MRKAPRTSIQSSQSAVDTKTSPPNNIAGATQHETDIAIIGSGIGGLCCAALLSKYGYKVTVYEAHYHPGGAAHGFEVQDYHFDAGPSFFAGLSGPPDQISSNPLKQVLDTIGETPLPCTTYDRWNLYLPDGSTHPCICSGDEYRSFIRRVGGETAYTQWCALESAMAPLQQGAALFPAAAIRSDPGVLLTAARFGPSLLKTAFMVNDLTGPFSNIVDRHVTDPWLKQLLDLETFVLSGMLAKDTIAAEMAFMFMERNSGTSTIDYPMGGSRSIIDALVRGIEKHGGRVLLQHAVDEICIDGGRATGINVRDKHGRIQHVKAKRAVVSNASVWNTAQLLKKSMDISPSSSLYSKNSNNNNSNNSRRCIDYIDDSLSTPRTGSFMHLHLGIDATDLPHDLECHHLIVNSWNNIKAPQNVCIASIPSVFDKNLAPPGKAVVHAYTAGNEPWEIWENIKPGSKEYKELKKERTQCLWEALEKCLPNVRDRAELVLEGTPHTHSRFLRRYKGTYGAAISARNGSFPGPHTDIPGLYRCGDSCQPGIGVPAAAASGMITANTLVPVWSHMKLLDSLNF